MQSQARSVGRAPVGKFPSWLCPWGLSSVPHKAGSIMKGLGLWQSVAWSSDCPWALLGKTLARS